MTQKKITMILMLVTLLSIAIGCNQPQEQKETTDTTDTANTASEPAKPVQKAPADKNKLVGTWTRTDAPYQIKILEMMDGGMMKAGYFNPQSINVGKAQWADAAGFLKIYIELSDTNYPGSNYTLTYYPEKDLLAGKYYQAVEGTTYDVGFSRAK